MNGDAWYYKIHLSSSEYPIKLVPNTQLFSNKKQEIRRNSPSKLSPNQ